MDPFGRRTRGQQNISCWSTAWRNREMLSTAAVTSYVALQTKRKNKKLKTLPMPKDLVVIVTSISKSSHHHFPIFFDDIEWEIHRKWIVNKELNSLWDELVSQPVRFRCYWAGSSLFLTPSHRYHKGNEDFFEWNTTDSDTQTSIS